MPAVLCTGLAVTCFLHHIVAAIQQDCFVANLSCAVAVCWVDVGDIYNSVIPSLYKVVNSRQEQFALLLCPVGVKGISKAGNTAHIVALCWVHSVIGFGFFVLQSWIPAYLTHLGVTDLNRVGLLSGVPWVVSTFRPCRTLFAVLYLQLIQDVGMGQVWLCRDGHN